MVKEDLDDHFEVIEELGHILKRDQATAAGLKFVDNEEQTDE